MDAIAHLFGIPEPLDPAAAYRLNVQGTARLLEAAARAGVRRIAFKSSTSVYGASAQNPYFIPESAAATGLPGDRRAEHLLEVEARLARAAAKQDDLAIAVLRFAPILGERTESRLAAYLAPGRVPTSLGFDPRIQLIAEDDVVEALAHALAARFHGAVNVAAPGVLPLHRVLRLAGRTSLPVPHALLGPALALHARLAGRPHLRMDPEQLRFPPVGDLERMRSALRFAPAREAIDVVRDFAAARDSAGAALARQEAAAERDRLREALRRQTSRSQRLRKK